MKRILVLVCIVLGGCLTAGKRSSDATRRCRPRSPRPQARRRRQPPLAVESRHPTGSTPWASGYRLLRHPARLHGYSQVRWAGPPAGLINSTSCSNWIHPHGRAGAVAWCASKSTNSARFCQSQVSRGTLQGAPGRPRPGAPEVAERVLRIENRRHPIPRAAWRRSRRRWINWSMNWPPGKAGGWPRRSSRAAR